MLARGDFFMLSRSGQGWLIIRVVRFAKSSRYRSAIPSGSKIAERGFTTEAQRVWGSEQSSSCSCSFAVCRLPSAVRCSPFAVRHLPSAVQPVRGSRFHGKLLCTGNAFPNRGPPRTQREPNSSPVRALCPLYLVKCHAEKQPTGRGPEGCDENGPAAVPRLRDRLRPASFLHSGCFWFLAQV